MHSHAIIFQDQEGVARHSLEDTDHLRILQCRFDTLDRSFLHRGTQRCHTAGERLSGRRAAERDGRESALQSLSVRSG